MKVAFVTPWYGPDIPGGAEAEARRTVEHLVHAGIDVEVLTTCVRDFRSDWNHNYHQRGTTQENGVTVRRFPVRRRDYDAFDRVNWKLMHNQPVTPEEECTYVRESVRSPELTTYIADNTDRYVFFFIPYMFGTTYWGLSACDGDAVLIPCLHDESYARMGVFRRMFSTVHRLVLHTRAELELATSLYELRPDAPVLLGEGVDTDFDADGAAFRQKYGITGPFLLYAGRKDHGKNVDLLIEYFRRYRQQHPDVGLVLLGGGRLPADISHDEGIYDLGFVSAQDKYDAYAAASVLCQPSERESFSLVLMEAWVAGTPALVHANCAVTTEHCRQSNGGLYFAHYAEFAACLDLLLARPNLSHVLGRNGRQYVLANFHWDIIVERYRRLIGELVPA